jgi:hypothetical protein
MPDETPETPENAENAENAEKAPSNVGRASLLSRPTDYVERPGFRNPSNKRTKAQKKGSKSR